MKKDEAKDKLFFRYQKINGNTKKNLEQNVLYFNDPGNFNDPFDCKIDTIYEGTKEDWSSHWLNYGINPKIIDQWIRDKTLKLKRNRKKNIYVINRAKISNASSEESFEKHPHRVCCFSETKLNILMWSHYAENHQGICLCFRTHKKGDGYFLTLDSKSQILFPVLYDNEKPPTVNMLIEEQREILMNFILTKYTDWNYEYEYRIPIMKHEFEHDFTKKFRKEDLEGVIFGLNAKSDKIKEICEIIDTHYLQQGINVNLYRTHRIPGEFAIGIKKIQSIDKYLKTRS